MNDAEHIGEIQPRPVPPQGGDVPLNLDDDTPLEGGVCDMTPGCESCQ